MAYDYGSATGDVGDDDVVPGMAGAKLRLQLMAQSLSSAATFLETIVILLAVLGLIGGLVVALHTGDPSLGENARPDVITGIAIMVGAVVLGVLYWAVFRAIHLFAELASFNVESDTERHRYQWQGESAREKECPDCCEDVWSEARVCPFCRYRFAPAAGG